MRQASLLTVMILNIGAAGMVGCGFQMDCHVAPSISGGPSNQTAIVGQSALFTAAASGDAPITFQWMENGAAIPGATQASFLTPALRSGDSGATFSVMVSNKFGTVTSSPATLSVSTSGETNMFFVAPNGNDANPGTIDQPFLTIQHCASSVSSSSTCAIRAGTYRETVTPNSGITITAFNHEAVVVDGSDPVSGWTLYQGSIYRTKANLKSDDTNQLFVGSDMMTEARWPNGDDLFHVNWATAIKGTDSSHIVDPSLPSLAWTGAKIHIWSGQDPFGHETGTVTASTAGQLTINVEIGTCTAICPQPGGLYYLFGTLAALDAEREWFYDTNAGFLYFMAPGKVDPNTLNVRFKNRQYGFDLRGKSNVTLRGIELFACTIVMDPISANNTLDAIDAQYVSHFTTLPTPPDYWAPPNQNWGQDWGVLSVHENDSGIVINGSGNVLENSRISFSAGNGVALEGSQNTITNNLIENIDYMGNYASGIVIDGNNNVVQNNTITTVGRHAILVNAVTNEDISYNNLLNTMQLSRDGGAIYACCAQVATGTRIHHNWMHDSTPAFNYGLAFLAMSGVDLDNNSSGFEIDQNVLWNNHRSNILVNGLGAVLPNSNYIHNNTVPDSSTNGLIWITSGQVCATRIVANRVLVKVGKEEHGTACTINDNTSQAAGAADMTPTSQVGCNFDGCSSSPPPAILPNGSFTGCAYLGPSSLPYR